MSFMRKAVVCLAVTLTLTACGRQTAELPGAAAVSASTTPPAATAETTATVSSAVPAPPAPESRVYIDPASGELRAPSTAELAADAARRRQSGTATVKVAPGVVITPLPGGITEYNLGGAGQVEETACLQKDGRLGACSETQKAELRAAQKPERK